MARKLPWKRASEAASSNSVGNATAHNSRLPASGPAAQNEKRDILRTHASRRHARRVLDSDPIRSPSTSPPPERPREELMIPGPLNDDKYRMVDDEFLHIAQRFTAHLHRAEYDRLKALAKAQNADTIREMERPVVASATPTIRARHRSISAQRAMKQRKALESTGDGAANDAGRAESDEVTTPWAGAGLRGLMDVPRREGRTIMPATSALSSSSRTRAAAGYSSKSSSQQGRAISPSPSLPPLPSSKKIKFETPSNAHSTTTALSRNASQHPRIHHNASDSNLQAASSSIAEAARGKRRSIDQDADLDDDPFGLHERRMSRKKSREQLKRPQVKGEVKGETNRIDLSSIPSFL
ncbi:hypothetical protein TARUN_3472 [Trichoderma arundinaceum]|uniref:Uncharacterized protein n=1 Tax=Trichoderma arundinaceum TaxID=490622 RepID=A0A395NRR0_TRIAR|nr:hypothetical protein TARUN_3472 [Trichoderma arundinaceum]